jgi:glycosyltransferase involved in cell wall biosynthesis
MRRLKILTWHTHGAYLHYLTQAPHDFYVMCKPGRPPGYGGRSGHLPWGDNVHDLPVERARFQPLDCILYQDDPQYFEDRERYLTEAQRRLPALYIEHDTPRENPVEQRHPVQDANVMLVHVTHFNRLMWDSGRTPSRVIEHGVIDPGYRYTGELEKGLVVVNNIRARGRRLGYDVYERTRSLVDLVGLGAQEAGGIGEVLHADLPAFAGRYRFLFNPIRWTSLGLGVIEAMMAGLPVVALATTEMVTVVRDGVNGFHDTDVDALVERMKYLLAAPEEAARLGMHARRAALERFDIRRFVRDWDEALAEATGMQRERFVA